MSKGTPNKTQASNVSVTDFLSGIANESQRQDSETLIKIMQNITGQQAVMWGPSIIGFDQYHYTYDSGREGDMAAIGFSPRTDRLVVYLMDGVGSHAELLQKLGPHKTSKACLYIKRLEDVDLGVLEEIVSRSYRYIKAHNGNMDRAA